MGEESRQVKKHIDVTREELGRDIERLQMKARDTFDWRAQFQERPMTMIGLAFGAGALLSTLGSNHRTSFQGTDRTHNPRMTSPTAEKAMEVWDRLKSALVGVAAVKAQEFLEGVVPGFRREYEKIAPERNQNSTVKMKSVTAD